MKFPLSALITVALLAGCQSTTFDLKNDTLFQQTIPVCQSDTECDKVWNAARQWVAQATPQGLAIDTTERLQTFPADVEALDWETDITVKKIPMDGGKYQIVIETLCNSAINNCNAERKRMRQFNEDMARYVSTNQSRETLRIIREGVDMSVLFNDYATSLKDTDLREYAQQYYLPTLIISGDADVRQLRNNDDVIAFLTEVREHLNEANITRIEAQNQQLLASNQTSAIMKLQWAFYDADDDLQYTQKAIYNLIKVGKGWKIITVLFDN